MVYETMQQETIAGPRPVLKWAGGKRQLLPELLPRVSATFDTYIEPFAGGAALFFQLRPRRAILIDNNPELMNVYRVIKGDVGSLVTALGAHVNEKDHYYAVRNADRDPEAFQAWSAVDRAARTIYMNKVCFNGLYRVNKRGEFNVPFGTYDHPVICDEENLRAVHVALQGVELINDDFTRVLDIAKEGDFVYFDPPYVPLSTTASFTSYTRDCFDWSSQERLCEVFKTLDDRGCKLLLSNSHSDLVLDLYKDYHIEVVMANRAINCKGTGRKKIKEILVRNET